MFLENISEQIQYVDMDILVQTVFFFLFVH